MRTIKVRVYEYKELNEEAKSMARQWLLEDGDLYQWEWDNVQEDAKNIGLRIDRMDSEGRRPSEGRFVVSAMDTAERIKKEHGPKCETYKTAFEYLKSVKPEPDYDNPSHDTWEDENEELEREFLRSLLEDYRIMGQKSEDYINSEEYISEMMEANGYTFTKDGERFG